MSDFERLIDEAWPAFLREDVGGWRLRYADGVTKRANSVWPLGGPGDVAAAEAFYAARGVPVVFQVGDAPELDELLERRGYDLVDPTLVMAAELDAELPVKREADIRDEPSPEWLATWWSVDGRYEDGVEAARRIVTGVPSRYASVEGGVGRGVPQGEWLGVYCMAVAPGARRQGIARDVLHALLNDGRERGARRAYLCVTEANAGAQALYSGAGFRVVGRYHYRVRGVGGPR